MFGGGNSSDLIITKDLCVEQLMRETEASSSPIWLKTEYSRYDVYYWDYPIKEGMKLCFKLFFPLTHDDVALDVFLSKKRKRVQMFIVRGPNVRELITNVVNTKKYYYDNKT